jgi:hypothetical protein
MINFIIPTVINSRPDEATVAAAPVALTEAELGRVHGGFLWAMIPLIDKVSTMLGGGSMRNDAQPKA